MADRENVIAGLEDIQKHLDTGYSFAISWKSELIRDALELLKEQEHKDKMFNALEDDWKRLKELLKEQDNELLIQHEEGFHDGYGQALCELNAKQFVKVVRCKDCKHRPKVPDWETYEDGADIEFPEGSKCPCQCSSDRYYSWYPDDDWFCADGERK